MGAGTTGVIALQLKCNFIGIDKARFRNPVFPGDQLILEAKLLRQSSRIWKYETFATVNGKRAAEAVLLCTEKAIDE